MVNKTKEINKYNGTLDNAIKSMSDAVTILSKNDFILRTALAKDANIQTTLDSIVKEISSLKIGDIRK